MTTTVYRTTLLQKPLAYKLELTPTSSLMVLMVVTNAQPWGQIKYLQTRLLAIAVSESYARRTGQVVLIRAAGSSGRVLRELIGKAKIRCNAVH
jgi:hypothetical protein